jgi:hypothetical protein
MNLTPTAFLAVWGAAALATSPAAQEKPTLDDPAPRVRQRIQLWQPEAAERRFDDIGWVGDILQARRLAREHNRPVFLFTHDGHMAVGRC